ncbi:ABC transporter permease [Streptomyces sp. NPDC004237]|uniref:branched-chain amino acid ABC transporter permease n=1 Tax=Streptomyces sp. NPDC004237 TaxID=3154455 RepID=UPI0033BF7F43
MLAYIFAGIALGSIYAISAAGIVVTYVASGVLNFAFGAMAFVLARFFYYLNTEHGWGVVPSLLVAVFAAGPALGAALYLLLFRHLQTSSPLIRIVSTIGVSVALPAVAVTIFGDDTITTAPGLVRAPVPSYRIFGAVVGLDQIVAFGCVVGVVVLGTLLLRGTDLGLKVRAMVDTKALTSLSGVNPSAISIGVWMVTTTLAGLAGVLTAPSTGLTPEGMTALMAVAFAAVVAARLTSLAAAVGVAMGMGVLTDVIQKFLPSDSSLTNATLVSIPFFVMGAFLIVHLGVSGRIDEAASTGGALDRAIRPMGGDAASTASGAAALDARSGRWLHLLGPVLAVALFALLPLLLPGHWLTSLGSGFAFAVVFLSFTVVVGEGGMIWLCQASFAGIGAIATAQFATNHGFDPLLAVFMGALLATPIGVVIGLLTIRLGNLYVALVTLTVGLLAETLIFTRDLFSQSGLGVAVTRPGFISGDRSFAYFTLAVFVVLAVIVVGMRRSTTGLALAAIRSSEPGARTLGLSVLGMKLLVAAFSTFIAAVGGGLLALNYESAMPTSYATFGGLIWLAVLVTIGLRSTTAAILAGLSFTLLPDVFQTYLLPEWGNVPTILFGLGAVMVAVNPDGQIAMHARQVQALLVRIAARRKSGDGSGPPPQPPAPPGAASSDVPGLLKGTTP